MAHYAFLNGETVVEVIVGRDENDGSGVDWEQHYAEVRGLRCKRTSYNTQGGVHLLGGMPFRLNYAGIGYQYRDDLDAFIPPCPGEDFTLDEASGVWVQN